MKIGIVSDHQGVDLKNFLKANLKDYQVVDYSPNNYPTDDYPDYGIVLAENVAKNKVDMGIAICGSGIGISIACNKVKKIRCSKVSNVDEAKYTRQDNDANIIALSAKNENEEALKIVNTFITTPFSNIERHIRRINKITEYEETHEC